MPTDASHRVVGALLLLLGVCLSLGSALGRSTGLWGAIGRASAFGAIVLALLAVVVLAYVGIGSLGRRR